MKRNIRLLSHPGAGATPRRSEPPRLYVVRGSRGSSWLYLLGLAALSLLGLPTAGRAQEAPAEETGRIVGRIVSEADGEPLQNAQVYLPGRGNGSLSSLDGRYVIRSLPGGSYDVRVELIGYGAKTVTGVEVDPGRTTTLDVQLTSRAVEIRGITVSAEAERGSTTALLTERRRASAMSDAVGREQMSRSPDGDAAAALKRVPGLTVVEDRFAYVRGLGERYTSTTLNGAPLASPVPDKKVMPLDLFPSGLLESIVTSKSYSPEQPGDYAGGLIELRTRDFPPNRLFTIGAGTSWSSEASFHDGLGYDAGGDADFLGFPGSARGLPAIVPRDRRVSSATMSAAELEAIGEAFTTSDFGPVAEQLPVNSSLSITYGDDFALDDDERLGFISSVSYSNSFSSRRNQIERVFQNDAVDDPEVDYRGDLSTHSVQWGGLFGLTYQPAGHSQLSLSGIYNRQAEDHARIFQGFNLDKNTNQLNSRIQYIATELTNLQLRGEHALDFLNGTSVEWRGAFTRARRFEPSTREALYQQVGDRYIFDDFVQSGSIFHQDQGDEGYSTGLVTSVPFELRDRPGSLSLGVSADQKERNSYTRRFRFRPDRSSGTLLTGDVLALPPNELIVPEHIGPNGFRLEESTFRTDNYDASESVRAAFVKLEAEFVDAVRVSGGVRVERLEQTVTPFDLFPMGLEPVEGADLEETDLLPAVNLTWAVSESTNLRGSVSRTLGRPQLRELAPFGFADYAGGYLVLGNPTLERSRIRNLDLRWEWFPRGDAVVAISAFHKKFDHPIEVFVLPSTEKIQSWVNAPAATNHGVELEVRSGLDFLSGVLEPLSFNGNVTLVESEVDVAGDISIYLPGQGVQEVDVPDRPRSLAGQSPYVVNLGLTWFEENTGTSASILFNRYGERIDAVGDSNTPDIVEEGRSTLDVVFERPFGSFDVKLAASRLLGNEVSFTQGGALLRQYDLGRSLSLGITWRPLD